MLPGTKIQIKIEDQVRGVAPVRNHSSLCSFDSSRRLPIFRRLPILEWTRLPVANYGSHALKCGLPEIVAAVALLLLRETPPPPMCSPGIPGGSATFL